MDACSVPFNLLASFLGQTFLRWESLPSRVYQLLSPFAVSPFTHRAHPKRGKISSLGTEGGPSPLEGEEGRTEGPSDIWSRIHTPPFWTVSE